MTTKDGKDCLHEDISMYPQMGSGVDFICDDCGKPFKEVEIKFVLEDEYVIRTKAYDRERKDMIGAARKMVKLKDTIAELCEVLDALGGK